MRGIIARWTGRPRRRFGPAKHRTCAPATVPARPALEAIPVARRVRLRRRRLAEQLAQVDELLLRRRALLQFGNPPLGDELARLHGFDREQNARQGVGTPARGNRTRSFSALSSINASFSVPGGRWRDVMTLVVCQGLARPARLCALTALLTTFTGQRPSSTRRTSLGAPRCSPSMARSLYQAAWGLMITFSRVRRE